MPNFGTLIKIKFAIIYRSKGNNLKNKYFLHYTGCFATRPTNSGVIVDMKINIIKQKTMGRKCLLGELGGH